MPRGVYVRDVKTVAERFWQKVLITESCWLWQGATEHGGYGSFRVGDHSQRAHRVAYMLTFGFIPEGLQPDHLCRNRLCVNPYHLEMVTQRENILRGISSSAQYAKRISCSAEHPFNPQNTYICKNGARRCRKCHAAKQRQYKKATLRAAKAWLNEKMKEPKP